MLMQMQLSSYRSTHQFFSPLLINTCKHQAHKKQISTCERCDASISQTQYEKNLPIRTQSDARMRMYIRFVLCRKTNCFTIIMDDLLSPIVLDATEMYLGHRDMMYLRLTCTRVAQTIRHHVERRFVFKCNNHTGYKTVSPQKMFTTGGTRMVPLSVTSLELRYMRREDRIRAIPEWITSLSINETQTKNVLCYDIGLPKGLKQLRVIGTISYSKTVLRDITSLPPSLMNLDLIISDVFIRNIPPMLTTLCLQGNRIEITVPLPRTLRVLRLLDTITYTVGKEGFPPYLECISVYSIDRDEHDSKTMEKAYGIVVT